MPRKPADKKPKREPPIQFRLSADLVNLFAPFHAKHQIDQNEAAKCLMALALTNLDARCYAMVEEMAQSLGGTNAFVRACAHIDTSLNVAGKLRPEINRDEVERLRFVLSVVRDFLASKRKAMQSGCPWAGIAVESPPSMLDQQASASGGSDPGSVATEPPQPPVVKRTARRNITGSKKFQELFGPGKADSEKGESGQHETSDQGSE